MSKFYQNTILYFLGNFLPVAGQFFLLPIYTSHLTPEDYGITNSISAFSSLFSLVITISLGRSIYRLYYDFKTENDKRDFLGTINIGIFFIATIGVLLAFLFHDLLGSIFKSIEFYPYIFLAVLTCYLTVFENVPKTVFVVKEKAKYHFILGLIQFLLNNAFIVYLVVFNEYGAKGYLIGLLAGSLTSLPLYLIISFKNSNFVFKKGIFKSAFFYSLPLLPSQLAVWVMTLSNRVFLDYYQDMRSVGLFSLGYKIASLGLYISDAFKKAYDPVFFKIANEKEETKAKGELMLYNNVYLIGILIITFAVVLISKEVLVLFFESAYQVAYTVIPIISLSYFLDKMHGITNLSFYQLKKTKELMYLTIAMAGMSILLNFVFIPQYGELGAAYSMLFTSVLMFFIKYNLSKKYFFIKINLKLIGILLIVMISSIYLIDFYFNLAAISIFLSIALKFVLISMLIITCLYILYLQNKTNNIFKFELPPKLSKIQFVFRRFK